MLIPFLWILGFVILTIGVLIAFFAGSDVVSFLHADKIPDYRPAIVNNTAIMFPSEKLVDWAMLDFQTENIFAVLNPINYTYTAKINEPEKIGDIFVIDFDASLEMPMEEGMNYGKLIHQANQTGHLIQLEKITNDIYQINGSFTPQNEQKIKFSMFTEGRSTGVDIVNFKNELIVYPYSAKLDSDTNKAVLQQVNETRITNDRLLGFTIILISLVPLGLVLEKQIH